MKGSLLKIVLMLFYISSMSQNIDTLNNIIIIDETIIKKPLSIKFTFELEGKRLFVYGNYLPGNITIDSDDLKKLKSKLTEKIEIEFSYQTYKKEKPYFYKYNIDYKKLWLTDKYTIIKLFNLDKRKYSKKYRTSSLSKNYAIGIEGYSSSIPILAK